MADPQHLHWLLKEGVAAWNDRRRSHGYGTALRHPNLQGADLQGAALQDAYLREADMQDADLRDADLRGADMQDADLRDADLRGADLQDADLRGAKLQYANMREVNLRGAYLQKANLQRAVLEGTPNLRADLQGADLQGADLQGAKLQRVNLQFANCQEAILKGADMQETNLQGADLERADLGSAYLSGADVRTKISAQRFGRTDLTLAKDMTQSQVDQMIGDTGVLLPKGLRHPDHWDIWEKQKNPDGAPESASKAISESEETPAESVEETVSEPFVFLSYSSENREDIALIRSKLMQEDIPCWWDQDIRTGDNWRSQIEKKLQTATVVLTFWTMESVASDAVKEEASVAQRRRKLAHVRLDGSKLPYGFAETQYQNLFDWSGDTDDRRWKRLVAVLKDRLNPPALEVKRAKLGATGPRAAVAVNGKIDVADMPLDGRPELNDPPTLHQVYVEIGRICESLYKMWKLEPPQTSRKIRVTIEEAERNAKIQDGNWFTWTRLQGQLNRQISREEKEAWRGFDDEVSNLEGSILELRPFLEPKLETEPADQGIDLAPEIRLAESHTEDIEQLSEAVEDLLSDPVTVEVLTDRAIKELRKDKIDLEEGLEDGNNPNENVRQQRYSIWRLALKGIGGFAATSIAILAGMSVNLLTSPEAAKTLLTRMEYLLDLVSKFI